MEARQNERWVNFKVGGYQRRCLESKLPLVYKKAEEMTQWGLEHGVPKETLEEMYKIEIVSTD